jgi:hypothetical protein
MCSLRRQNNVLFNFKIDWVLVCRQGRTFREVDDVGCTNLCWDFKSVFDRERRFDSFSAVTHVSSESNSNRLFYDRSNGRRGVLILDDVSGTTVNTQLMGTKRRKRNVLWKIRYLRTEEFAVDIRIVDPNHLIPVYSSLVVPSTANSNEAAIIQKSATRIPVLVTADTATFRLLAASQIPMDKSCRFAVLEIGSSTGGTSSILWHQVQKHSCDGRWMGIDTSSEMVSVVRGKLSKKFPNLKETISLHNLSTSWAECCQVDPLLDPDATSVLVRNFFGCDRLTVDVSVFIDIGGNREEGAILRMVDWVLRTFQSDNSEPSDPIPFRLHQIVIKSELIHAEFCNIGDSQESLNTVDNGDSWFRSRLGIALRSSFPKHPLQAAKRFVPKTPSCGGVDSKIICRYYNYHKSGCAKKRDDMCPYDHDHCHVCLGLGHTAQVCPLIFDCDKNEK